MRTLIALLLLTGVATADDEKDCKKGKGKACLAIANAAADAGEVDKAFEHYSLACKARVQLACWEMSARLVDGVGTTKDEKAGIAGFEKACKANEPRACNSLGTMWSAGKYGASVDHTKSKPFYEKACKLKSGLGCFNLGNVFRLGEGMEPDVKKAIPWFEKSCTLEEAKGCTELGIIHYEGKVVTKNVPKAVSLFEKSCKLGSEVACKNLKLIQGK